MAQQKEDKTPSFESLRDSYRKACPRHVAEFESVLPEDAVRNLLSIADQIRRCGNYVSGELQKRYDQMTRTKKYRALLDLYGKQKESLGKIEEATDEYKEASAKLKETMSALQQMQEAYNVTKSYAEDLAKHFSKVDGLQAVFAQVKADDVWHGMEAILYRKGEKLGLHQRGDLPAIKAKQSNRSIIMSVDKHSGELMFTIDGVGKFGVTIPKKDLFLQEEYNAIIDFMLHPEQEKAAIEEWGKTKVARPVFRPCYAAIVLKEIRGKTRVYVQVTIAAPAIPKKDKNGNPRRKYGTGVMGIDLGPQSIATVSDVAVHLQNLAERNGESTKQHNKELRYLQRAMDRSRRDTNPDRFNEDGTYKKGSKGKWHESNRYKKLKYRYHELNRKDALSRKYAANEDVNKLLEEASIVVIEESIASKHMKRAKKTERSDRTITVTNAAGEQKEIHPYKQKKRGGKSVLHRNPGYYFQRLKLIYGDNFHVVPRDYRASQYDFMLNEYIPKKLSERWHDLPDGRKVQRDIMSAFLLYCADVNFAAIDRETCIKKFDRFWEMHQECIAEIIESGHNVCNSGIKMK